MVHADQHGEPGRLDAVACRRRSRVTRSISSRSTALCSSGMSPANTHVGGARRRHGNRRCGRRGSRGWGLRRRARRRRGEGGRSGRGWCWGSCRCGGGCGGEGGGRGWAMGLCRRGCECRRLGGCWGLCRGGGWRPGRRCRGCRPRRPRGRGFRGTGRRRGRDMSRPRSLRGRGHGRERGHDDPGHDGRFAGFVAGAPNQECGENQDAGERERYLHGGFFCRGGSGGTSPILSLTSNAYRLRALEGASPLPAGP